MSEIERHKIYTGDPSLVRVSEIVMDSDPPNQLAVEGIEQRRLRKNMPPMLICEGCDGRTLMLRNGLCSFCAREAAK